MGWLRDLGTHERTSSANSAAFRSRWRPRRSSNAPSDAATEPFLPVLVDQVGQFLGPQPLNQLPGRLADGGVKAEIEFPAALKAESPLFVRQLVAGHPKIQEDPIDRVDLQLSQDRRDVAKVGVDRFHWQIGERFGGDGEGPRITVQGDDQA